MIKHIHESLRLQTIPENEIWSSVLLIIPALIRFLSFVTSLVSSCGGYHDDVVRCSHFCETKIKKKLLAILNATMKNHHDLAVFLSPACVWNVSITLVCHTSPTPSFVGGHKWFLPEGNDLTACIDVVCWRVHVSINLV